MMCFTNAVRLTASSDSRVELAETLEISLDTSILDTFTGLTLPSVLTFGIDDANGNNNLKGNFFLNPELLYYYTECSSRNSYIMAEIEHEL